MTQHKHTCQGVTLKHDHPGGDADHGYFEHGEDLEPRRMLMRAILGDKVAIARGTPATVIPHEPLTLAHPGGDHACDAFADEPDRATARRFVVDRETGFGYYERVAGPDVATAVRALRDVATDDEWGVLVGILDRANQQA